jgi:hypothetical protein
MYTKANTGAMRQNTLYLAGLWMNRIQQCIISWWMFVLCLFILSIAMTVQAVSAQDEDDTSTSGDGSAAIAAEDDSVPNEVKEVFVPQSTISAIICLVDGFVLACFSSDDSSEPSDSGKSSDSSKSGDASESNDSSDSDDSSGEFMAGFTAGIIGVYIFCVAMLPFDGNEEDSVKKNIYVAVSTVLGFLTGILSIIFKCSGIVIASAFGSFIGVVF